MNRLTEEQIKEINHTVYLLDNEQGVFVQPNGIPTAIKGHVIYRRTNTGGMTGGGYHEDDYARPYYGEAPKQFYALDEVLKVLAPAITFLRFREIERLIQEATYDEDHYYGNQDDYQVDYVVLEDLYKFFGI